MTTLHADSAVSYQPLARYERSTGAVLRDIERVEEDLRGPAPRCTCTPEQRREFWGHCTCGAANWASDLQAELDALDDEYALTLAAELAELDALGF
ncbi:hypothetical protein Dxin01_00797 [Deinococcus xinjiangensis]|uniref:Uncharacterized protein n=1 Tax=Deinococcus xinjiangensis TaxID=457454 RepID=A0ABP9V8W3_9DEIO